MRLKGTALSFVINFLLGVAWATAFIGAMSTFLSFYSQSFFFAFVAALFALVPGMIAVLLLEYFIVSRDKYIELQKQTALLQKILEQQQNS
jgi:purine-cytosine permease-like protein